MLLYASQILRQNSEDAVGVLLAGELIWLRGPDATIDMVGGIGPASPVLWSECLCSLKTHMLKPIAQCDSIKRWGL